MTIGKLKITARRWGWPHGQPFGRFGGGWNYKLGVSIGGTTVILDLLIGSLCFTWCKL